MEKKKYYKVKIKLKKKMYQIQQWLAVRRLQRNTTNKLEKTSTPKLESMLLVDKILQDRSKLNFGTKIMFADDKYAFDIAKNIVAKKMDVYAVDMKSDDNNLIRVLQAKLNIPIEYDLSDVFRSNHPVFIFIVNLKRSLFVKKFLSFLHEESKIRKCFTIIYCSDSESHIESILDFENEIQLLN